MNTTRRRRRRRRGQAIVEFALILPVFLLIVFAAIEFGRAYYVMHLLASGAREGAREASLPNRTVDDVEEKIDTYLEGVDLSLDERTTSLYIIPAGAGMESRTEWQSGDSPPVSGDRVLVTIDYDFDVLSGSIIPGFSGTVTLTGRCAFRHE
jgi:Flp pilus assembly protein TadG